MKIAVISDIHSNYPVFNKAYQDAKNRNVDMFVFLGDYITDGFDGNKILDIIRQSKGYAINGNRELYVIKYDEIKESGLGEYLQYKNIKYAYDSLSESNFQYLKEQPIYQIINIMGCKICLAHGTPYNTRDVVSSDSYGIFDRLIEDYDCDIYLLGHTHLYYYTEYKGRKFINPGSIGLPTDDLPYKYGILEINDNDIKYEKIGIDYDYIQLEKYYKSTDYYQINTIWCELILLILKTGKEHALHFMSLIREKAKKDNIDISVVTPDILFIEAYQEYISKL